MEKISFLPLIVEFSNNSSLYNRWYDENQMKYGKLPSQTIICWVIEVIEPIVKSIYHQNSAPEKIHEIVKALYLESLKLIGSGLAIRYKTEYKTAWLLMAEIPDLVSKFPKKTISLLNDVLLNFHSHAVEKTFEWCQLMRDSSIAIKTIEDFKIVGRIYAWKCGLAHLRTRLKADFAEISHDLQQVLIINLDASDISEHIFDRPWPNRDTKFKGVQGGFKGSTGFFEHPPKLAQIDNQVFVTDSKHSYALFADQFGTVLIPADTVDSAYVISNSKRLETLEKWLGKDDAINRNTISSFVATKDTLVFTLQNSYFLYLYSLKNA